LNREPLRRLAEELAAEAQDVLPSGFPVAPAERDEQVRESVERSLADGSWAKYDGPRRRDLEAALAERFGHRRARTCCSGTFAVELALRALLLEPGDEVLLAGYDYPGNFRAIMAVAATPVLVDVEPGSFRLSVEKLEAARSDRTKAAIVSHLHGDVADGAALREWADRSGIALIEDFCQALGASADARPIGSFGHLSVVSFGGSKTLTAGRGGAVLVSDDTFAQRMTIFAERGNDAYPLSELQAAALLPQLATLDELNRRRFTNNERLSASLGRTNGALSYPTLAKTVTPGFYKWGLLLSEDVASLREEALRCLDVARLPAGEGFRGFARRAGRRSRVAGDLAESERAARSAVVIHHAALTAEEEAIAFYASALARLAQALEAST
jgi:dTDP-4-amino-4,6-dideoxygalactose transaminase